MKNINPLLFIVPLIIGISCRPGQKQSEVKTMADTTHYAITLMTLDPGHFHASLVQKVMYPGINPEVFVYAPAGPDVQEHLDRIRQYNMRPDNPTHWNEKIYTGRDYLEKMLQEKPGNVVIISGNNAEKTEYIDRCIADSLNVLADKPMVITPELFPELVEAFRMAKEKHVLLYDIMTERYEITSILQKELSEVPQVFGTLETGTEKKPSIVEESVHNFFKYVSGKALIRPAWYFDITQQGEGIADVTTHLVDLIQTECFPGQSVDYKTDIKMLSARHWTTDLTLDQFKKVTGMDSFPPFLSKYVDHDILKVYSNGEMTYRIKGKFAHVSVIWNFQAPEGAGDTHYSVFRGSLSNLIVRQGKVENYRPELYIEQTGKSATFEKDLSKTINEVLQKKYPDISLEKISGKMWRVNIPDKYRVGHEAHFGQVTEKFLEYLQNGDMPDWEVPGMIAKYYTTTEALKMARGK